MSQTDTQEDENRWTSQLAKMDQQILCLRALGILLGHFNQSPQKELPYVLRGAGQILLDRTDTLMETIDHLRGGPASD